MDWDVLELNYAVHKDALGPMRISAALSSSHGGRWIARIEFDDKKHGPFTSFSAHNTLFNAINDAAAVTLNAIPEFSKKS